jgi:hypothetical protein
MAVICVRGGGHQCPPDHKGYVPIGVRPHSRFDSPKGKGDGKGGWDHSFGFGRGFNAPVMTGQVPPLIYVGGFDISRWGGGKVTS